MQAAFPYIQGFVPVVLAWVVSPILAGICVLILYGLLRTFVLRAKRSFDIATIVSSVPLPSLILTSVIYFSRAGHPIRSCAVFLVLYIIKP